ncbi:hypothetical protein PoB_003441200 [Plakobranchus ocellatus]|uniref:Uncharacterized protein n=1 Tax=Plakobranchus ocellatus TaxID=259542 RepID=A0AAV4ALP3_9GAST|nr:hypothetical protein PoB_003441200 [Plakobranchus ocellatus]
MRFELAPLSGPSYFGTRPTSSTRIHKDAVSTSQLWPAKLARTHVYGQTRIPARMMKLSHEDFSPVGFFRNQKKARKTPLSGSIFVYSQSTTQVISGFQALRQARAPVVGLEPATERSL